MYKCTVYIYILHTCFFSDVFVVLMGVCVFEDCLTSCLGANATCVTTVSSSQTHVCNIQKGTFTAIMSGALCNILKMACSPRALYFQNNRKICSCWSYETGT